MSKFNIGDKVVLKSGESVQVTGVTKMSPYDDSPVITTYRVFFSNSSDLHFDWVNEDQIKEKVEASV